MKSFKESLRANDIQVNKGWYYYIEDGKRINLGCGLAVATKKFNSIHGLSGNVEDLGDTANQTEVVKFSGNPKNDNLDFEGLLDHIHDFDPKMEAGSDLDVFIDGVDSRLDNHATVKGFPLQFYWMKKDHNVQNGSGLITNKQYTVVSKSWPQIKLPNGKYRITVQRDDTPNEDFFSIQELVLCCCKKHQFLEKKKRLVATELLRSKLSEEQRNEKAKSIANLSNVDQIVGALNSENSSGRQMQAEHLSNNKGMSATEAMRKIQNASGDEAIDIASML